MITKTNSLRSIIIYLVFRTFLESHLFKINRVKTDQYSECVTKNHGETKMISLNALNVLAIIVQSLDIRL